MNPPATVRRNVQNQIRPAADRLVVNLQQVGGRADLLVLAGMIEPARADRDVDLAGQPIGPVSLALHQYAAVGTGRGSVPARFTVAQQVSPAKPDSLPIQRMSGPPSLNMQASGCNWRTIFQVFCQS